MTVSLLGLFIIIFALLLSFRRAFGERLSSPLLDRTCSVQLKGIAVLLVILSHLNAVHFVSLPYNLNFAGAWGVAIFLLVSGFGLTQSYLANGIRGNFLTRRFIKVLLPYVIVTAFWVLIDSLFLGKTYPVATMAMSLIGLDFSRAIDPTMWFVSFIIIWYLFFFIIFKLPLHDALKVAVLFVIAYVFRNHSLTEITKPSAWQWSLHAYLFPVGVIAGLYYKRVSDYLAPRMMALLLGFSALASFYIFGRYVSHSLVNLDRYSLANLAFALGLIAVIIIVRFYGLRSKALVAIGGISYELYLFEWALISKYGTLYIFSNKWVAGAFYICLLLLLSVLLQRTTHLLIRYVGGADVLFINHLKHRYASGSSAIKELPLCDTEAYADPESIPHS